MTGGGSVETFDMTVAERMLEIHGRSLKHRPNVALTTALALIVFGGLLTWKGANGEFTFSHKTKESETMLAATAPGIGFAFAGVVVLCFVIQKDIRMRTQHQDKKNPGSTEISS